VLAAAVDLLSESGLAAMELTDVADRAGVGSSTVYRRWGSKAALVADLLRDMAATSLPRADTGTLRGDLLANARLVRKTLSDARQGSLFAALIAAASSDADTAAALAEFYGRRVDAWAPCVTDAVARGEAPADTDAEAVIRAVSAPLYYRWLLLRAPITTRDVTRAVDAALAAVAAGVFAGPHPGSD
jgi:AcrR family transcriptional regulator